MLRCIFCGWCEEACPTDAIVLTPCGFDLARTLAELPLLQRRPEWAQFTAADAKFSGQLGSPGGASAASSQFARWAEKHSAGLPSVSRSMNSAISSVWMRPSRNAAVTADI